MSTPLDRFARTTKPARWLAGLGFAIALQRSLIDDGIDVLAIPGGQLALFVGAAAVVGVLAALWPGRRAARLDVLRAIATE